MIPSWPEDEPKPHALLEYLDQGSRYHLPFSKHALEVTSQYWHRIYNTTYTSQCFMLANLLRKDRDLVEVIRGAVTVILPPHVAKTCVAMLDSDEMPVPDASTLSRFRLTFDTGFMMVMRMRNRTDGSRNLFSLPARTSSCDSSGQAGLPQA